MSSHVYENHSGTAIVVVNQKCGYGSLQYHVEKGEIKKITPLNVIMRKKIKDSNVYKIFMCRHPYSRLESFYKHWIKMHPWKKNPEMMKNHAYYSTCSEMFSKEKFINRNISFEEFILTAIPDIEEKNKINALHQFRTDGHLTPQTKSFSAWGATVLSFDSVVCIEKRNFENLNSKMGIKLTHRNSTGHKTMWQNVDFNWTQAMKEVEYNFYKNDFDLLGYSKEGIND